MSGAPFSNGYQSQEQYGIPYTTMNEAYTTMQQYNMGGHGGWYLFPNGEAMQQGTSNHVTTQARMGTPQKSFLEEKFAQNPKPSTEEKAHFAQMWGLSLAKINNWFQNRRAAQKRSDKENAAANASQKENDNCDSSDDVPNLSEGESSSSSVHTKASPALSSTTGNNTPVAGNTSNFPSFSSTTSASTSAVPAIGQMSLSNVPVRGMTNSSKPRKQRPTALNLTHSNRAPSLAVQSPGILPASPLRPPSSSRKPSTPGLGIGPHGIIKSRTWKSETRAAVTLPQNGDLSSLADQYEIKLPTGITDASMPPTYMPAHLPTPPLATDASMNSISGGACFNTFQAPESPITPMVGSLQFLRRPSIPEPLPSSAAAHFPFGNDTPPQTAPPSQTTFTESTELLQPYPKPQRDLSFLFEHQENGNVNRDMDAATSGSASREITPMEQMQNAAIMQFPLPGNFDMFTPTPGKPSSLDSFMSQNSFDFENGVHTDWENITPVSIPHDASVMGTTMPTATSFNAVRGANWRG